MKAHIKQLFFAPALIVAGFASLFLFQNCSDEVSFDSNPSADRADLVGPGGVGVGGPPGGAGTSTGPINGGTNEIAITFNERPPRRTDVANGNSVIDYEITTTSGNITSVTCELDGQVIDCEAVDRIPITNPAVGPHTFTVRAETDTGVTATETIPFEVFREVVEKTKIIDIDESTEEVDIIFNVDNSGSMEYEQNSMASRIATFMEQFKDLKYHIAVTTTSPIGNNVVWKSSLDYVDGKFVELEAGVHCVKYNQTYASDHKTLLQNSIVRNPYLMENGQPVIDPNTNQPYAEGNGWERGIFTTYRAFERAGNQADKNADCLRPNAPKHVILISDEDETLTRNDGTLLTSQNKSKGSALRKLVADTFGASTVFKFHSIIVNPETAEGASCLKIHGARYGKKYFELSQDTSGVVGSICAPDYAEQLGRIGQSISNSQLSYGLDCVATAKNGDMGELKKLPDGTAVTTAYSIQGDKLELQSRLSAGKYEVKYYCFQ